MLSFEVFALTQRTSLFCVLFYFTDTDITHKLSLKNPHYVHRGSIHVTRNNRTRTAMAFHPSSPPPAALRPLTSLFPAFQPSQSSLLCLALILFLSSLLQGSHTAVTLSCQLTNKQTSSCSNRRGRTVM